ncbi:hypothetical protein SPRG_15163 [Saprolegnia parasitica CBS 223.65]|uniref:Uncharacterized protein n=1 Tax=Saprolegnia parasitica (strain CBS 223.65) TaxID=695850 RepID=A0A067BJ46_SAPPC|nr:hypothetical protein SPRG_15163 [Saprolegnia parasitica CBS 223.65]KDO18454.1 hypothetical protein SPRG_15163 [Saprolegnia parasitica CBS 223.65]|eukprot:XP_012210832.1 hypothetical protein SPRG_15163 [Saprolegnia parasitica CBS 223.65]
MERGDRVSEKDALAAYARQLQRGLVVLRARRSMLLSWADVARALQEEMLEAVRDHRSLRQQLETHDLLVSVLKRWVYATAPAPTPSHQPSWSESYLFRGPHSTRRIGYKWLADQLYHCVGNVFSHSESPEPSARYQVSCEKTLFQIQGVCTRTLDCDLATASTAYWIAERSFAHCQQSGSFVLDDWIVRDENDVVYTREDVGRDHQAILGHSVYGRYHELNQSVIVVRSLLHDEMYPLDPDQWSVDSKQWNILEPLDGGTRVRSVYVMGHPATTRGFVRLQDFVKWTNLPASCEKAVLLQRLQHRFYTRQDYLRAIFDAHLQLVLEAVIARNRLEQQLQS